MLMSLFTAIMNSIVGKGGGRKCKLKCISCNLNSILLSYKYRDSIEIEITWSLNLQSEHFFPFILEKGQSASRISCF